MAKGLKTKTIFQTLISYFQLGNFTLYTYKNPQASDGVNTYTIENYKRLIKKVIVLFRFIPLRKSSRRANLWKLMME